MEFEVELLDFAHEPSWNSLEAGQKLDRAEKWKEQGNALYKQVGRGRGWGGVAGGSVAWLGGEGGRAA